MKVAILTNMMEFNPGYSLTGIVKDQVRMLHKNGNQVDLYVNEKYSGKGGEDLSEICNICPEVPFTHLIDYNSLRQLTSDHEQVAERFSDTLRNNLSSTPVAFTHDFIFTGWFLPYGLAVQQASQAMLDTRWLHWIHSIPSGSRDWWRIGAYGPRHKIAYPNKTDSLRVAEQYCGNINDVRVIPHIKDMRTWFGFCEETNMFIDKYPQIMTADVVQILPASTDRLSAKRVDVVISIFSNMKKMGFSVFLVVANQWATTKQTKESLIPYKELAFSSGLEYGKDFIFTSDLGNQYEQGVPQNMLRELLQMSNLFVFPTREESFGLVVPEASISGGCLMVLNKSLTMQLEISDFSTLYFDFGSYHTDHTVHDPDRYFSDIAKIIIERMRMNESVVMRTRMRQMYNMNTLYDKYYAPIMAEMRVW